MPTLGEVMYVRSTEEPVVFISERPVDGDDNFPDHVGGKGTVYVVRRPVASPTGIQSYKFFDFLSEELDTAEGVHKRNIQNMKYRQELMMAELALEAPVGHDQKPS